MLSRELVGQPNMQCVRSQAEAVWSPSFGTIAPRLDERRTLTSSIAARR